MMARLSRHLQIVIQNLTILVSKGTHLPIYPSTHYVQLMPTGRPLRIRMRRYDRGLGRGGSLLLLHRGNCRGQQVQLVVQLAELRLDGRDGGVGLDAGGLALAGRRRLPG